LFVVEVQKPKLGTRKPGAENDMQIPNVKIKPPGPKARAIIEKDAKYTAPAYGRVYPLVVKEGRGTTVEDVDGNVFLDFMAGIAVASTGHSHPRVVKAIEEQARKFLHICGSDFYFEPMAELAEKLSRLAPGSGSKKVFLTNSGTESVEAALKLARYTTGRKHILAFFGAFHGRTMGSLSLTASRSSHRARFSPFLPDVHHVPYGTCHRCPYNLKYGSCGIECVRYLENILFRYEVAPEEVAAIFVEPIQGEGGYIVPPPEYLPMLQELCRRHGILLVLDEIQSGFGRTGKMFACEHWGIEPDILCVAKGIASGLPLGAMIARSEISTWTPGTHGSTFGGNPVACAAALATIELIEEGLMKNAAEVGAYLKERLTNLQSAHPVISDVRGVGLMIGVEFARSGDAGAPDPKRRDQVVQRCFEKGLLLLGCGESTIRFCPSLILTRQEVDAAIPIFEAAIKETEHLSAAQRMAECERR
jgi:4-aminobutyrate aminotransferase